MCTVDQILGKPKFVNFKDQESARVETIRLIGGNTDDKNKS